MNLDRVEYLADTRAEALFVTIVTGRRDIVAEAGSKSYLFNYIIWLVKNNRRTQSKFGVEVKGVNSVNDIFHVCLTMQEVKNLHNTDFPVCLVVFNMFNDKIYYRWILDPSISDQPNHRLKLNINSDNMPYQNGPFWAVHSYELSEVTENGFDDLIHTVVEWYRNG